ncbi:hypothetical protein [uncultured Sphingomonas sp.]|uniref:hypothetical protein n=1 Tax=uncultured Sphingomonas sp. TaxID=158754 RepID=UPI0025EC1286|nr:hypothetical protein [uncultured Sphingomonas sp.]
MVGKLPDRHEKLKGRLLATATAKRFEFILPQVASDLAAKVSYPNPEGSDVVRRASRYASILTAFGSAVIV